MVIAGDTNNTDRQPLYGIGREAGELNGFAATHLTNKCYDRLVVAGIEMIGIAMATTRNSPQQVCNFTGYPNLGIPSVKRGSG